MKKMFLFYGFTILNSLAIVFMTICGMLLVYRDFQLFSVAGSNKIISSLPVILTFIFNALDVAYITNRRNVEENYMQQGQFTLTRRLNKKNRAQYLINTTIYFFSILVSGIGAVVLVDMIYKSVIEGIVLYSLLILVAAVHIFFVDNKYRFGKTNR